MSDNTTSNEPHGLPKVLIPAFACILAVNILVYGPSLYFGFLISYDDFVYIYRNPFLHELTWDNLRAIFSGIQYLHFDGYIPLTLVSFSFDYTFWKFDPFGYHLTQLILHAVNSFLVLVVLLQVRVPRMAALAAALVYTVHPVHVESVAWISERKNLLAGTFILSSIIFYVRHAGSGMRWGRNLWVSWALFVMALLSKSIAVMLPAVMILYDHCIAGRGWRLAEKIPFFAGALLAAAGTVYTQVLTGFVREYAGGSFATAMMFTLRVYWDYLLSLVFPFSLSHHYYSGTDTLWEWQSLLSYILIPCLIVFAARSVRDRPWFAFAAGWFVLWLLPVSNIVPIGNLRQDRYLYFPSLAVILFVLLPLFKTRLAGYRRVFVPALVGILVLLLGSLTVNYSFVFSSDKAFWGYLAERYPLSSKAQFYAGYHCWIAKDEGCAVNYYQKAIRADSGNAPALSNLGAIWIERGDFEKAKVYVERARRADLEYSSPYMNLAVIASRTGKDLDKIPEWRKKYDEIENSKKNNPIDQYLGAFRFR